jgi:mono/diheme cytochrome c family protein
MFAPAPGWASIGRMRPALVLVLLVGALALLGAGCGGDEDSGTEEPPATTTTTGGEGGDAANGAQVFASAGCGGCHTFAAANSTGSVGPDLDEIDVTFDQVVEQVTNGGGAMPAFGDELSEQEIHDVAAYVTGS